MPAPHPHRRTFRKARLPISAVGSEIPPEGKGARGFFVQTLVASAVVIATNVLGNYALARGLHEVGTTISWSPTPYLQAFSRPWVAVGVLFMVAWLISRSVLFTWADLSYVLPVTSFTYVLSAIVGAYYFGEQVGALRWAGILVITAGASLVAATYPETSDEEEQRE